MITEPLPADHPWFHVVDPDDATPAAPSNRSGRWQPTGHVNTLRLAASRTVARAAVIQMLEGTPVRPEDLRGDRGPALAHVRLPRRQTVVDAHSDEGLAALGLPRTFPQGTAARQVPVARTRAIADEASAAGAHGVWCRSADITALNEDELVWFATGKATADVVEVVPFGDWWYVREPRP